MLFFKYNLVPYLEFKNVIIFYRAPPTQSVRISTGTILVLYNIWHPHYGTRLYFKKQHISSCKTFSHIIILVVDCAFNVCEPDTCGGEELLCTITCLNGVFGGDEACPEDEEFKTGGNCPLLACGQFNIVFWQFIKTKYPTNNTELATANHLTHSSSFKSDFPTADGW